MKSITKLMVVAMLLVAALVVAPAAARTVEDGGTIYVGEEKLDLKANVFDGNSTGTLVYSPGETNQKTIRIGNTGDFNLLSASVGGTTGYWYAYGGTNSSQAGQGSAGSAGSVYVDVPSSSIDVVLNATTTSVDGKSITRGKDIQFRLTNNLDGLDGIANISIEVTTPGGGTVTTFEDVILSKLSVTTRESDPIVLRNATTGTYTAKGVIKNINKSTSTGFDTNVVTFEVTSGALAITSDKDTVVRNNPFTVTVTGESKTEYTLNVSGSGSNRPMIIEGQTAVKKGGGDSAVIETNAGGKASIEFNTTQADTKTYTIKVENLAGDLSDEVKVKVEAGSVTITTSGTGTYYIGEEITLSGTNTDNPNAVYLFMTGPNLDANGVNLTDMGPVTSGDRGSFTTANVEADDTWSKKWNTAGLPLDAGSYTIYAVSKDKDKSKLSDAKYATAAISLRTGFISATTSGATVAKGDKLVISGTAQGNPDDVFVWIFGKNYYGKPGALFVRDATVESDGSFEVELDSSDTENLAGGQYFVIVQHPMGGAYDTTVAGAFKKSAGSIGWDDTGSDAGWIEGAGINKVKLTGLQAPAAATALINALDSPNIPDTYVKLTFVVEEPQLFIDPISTKEAGSKFTITGTTNLAVGGTLVVDVTSAAFQPGAKTEASAFSGTGGSAIIEKGDGMNKWSFEVDATDFKPDQYIVTVESIEARKTATALFDMVEATEEPTTPVGEVTTPPAGEVTTPPAAETTTEPAPTPGFGALVALAGLGAVAFLVLRRK